MCGFWGRMSRSGEASEMTLLTRTTVLNVVFQTSWSVLEIGRYLFPATSASNKASQVHGLFAGRDRTLVRSFVEGASIVLD